MPPAEALEAKRTALVVIDLMQRIVDLPLAPRSGADVVATASRLASAFRAAGATVILVRAERPDTAEQPPGSGIVDGIQGVSDIVVVKRAISAFHKTGLDETLRARGVDTVVLAGIATNMGVESTARAAADHGYRVVFVEDAMSALTQEEHVAAVLRAFPRFGTVLTAADITIG